VWKLAQSPRVTHICCAPGNAGIAQYAECINLKPTDLDGLANFASNAKIDLTVVGPEAPLIAGIVDRFEARGLPVFGPATDPARLEGSKAFSKQLMANYGIPTALHWTCKTPEEAYVHADAYFADRLGEQLVIKADGIAAGKGVVLVDSLAEAKSTIDLMMRDRAFGDAGNVIVLEEALVGPEVSIMAFTDGYTVAPMPPVQDHKRAYDNDEGPNTGGMGCYSPVPGLPENIVQETVERVLKPAVSAIRELGIPYQGVLYAGIMVTSAGIKTLEFNCRFGDPETQVVMPLLETDLVDVLMSVVDCTLDPSAIHWKKQSAVCVVAASKGYPGDYPSGVTIEGLERASATEDCTVFHAGTAKVDGRVVTAGGRVLGVTGIGETIPEAISRAYSGMSEIRFDGMHYRRDIAAKAVRSS
jgi:phosphoribosylamine--glycine ligase